MAVDIAITDNERIGNPYGVIMRNGHTMVAGTARAIRRTRGAAGAMAHGGRL